MTNEYDGRNGNGYQPLPSESKGIAAPPRERVTDAELASHAANNLIAAEQTIAELRAPLAALEGQEPVAWTVRCDHGIEADWYVGKELDTLPLGTKLYAKPVPAEQTVAVPDGFRAVSTDWLKRIHRDLDACQKLIWANLRGCDPAYCGDAQARLAEIDAMLASAPQPPLQQESDCPHGVDDGACKECHLEGAWTCDNCGATTGKSCNTNGCFKNEAEPATVQDALRKRFDEIEFEVAQGRHTAASVFTQMRTAAMSTRPAQTEQSAVVQFGIRVEKLLCSKLGIEWTATGISIESLVDRLAERAAQTEQQRAVLPEGWSLKRVDPEDGVGFIIESPRRNGVSSGAAIWSDAENPAEQMLALILDKVTK